MVVRRGYRRCPGRISPCDADREYRLDRPACAVVDRLSDLQENRGSQLSLLVLEGDSVKSGPTWWSVDLGVVDALCGGCKLK